MVFFLAIKEVAVRLILLLILTCLGCRVEPPANPNPPGPPTNPPYDSPIGIPPLPDAQLTQTELDLVEAHNQIRTSRLGAASRLRIEPQLNKAAASQAIWMAEQNRLTHDGRNGLTLGERARVEGYQFIAVGENIAFTHNNDVEHVTQSWMNSAGHRRNILNTQYTDIGVSVKLADNGRRYWCVVFGDR